MKKRLVIALLLGFSIRSAPAAELTIVLPEPKWLLEQVTPPLGQQEGLILPPEQRVADQLWPLLRGHDYESVMALFRKEYPDAVANFEQGNTFIIGNESAFERLSPAMFYLVGHTFFSLEQYAPAETAFKSALAVLPDYVRVHESLGLLYLKTERYDEARQHLTRALELGMHSANLFEALGYLDFQERNYWGAVSAYQSALSLDPGNPQTRVGLMQSLAQTSQYDSALTLAEQMLQADPDDSDLWVYRARMCLGTGDRQGALASLEAAMRLGDLSLANRQVAANLHMEIGSIERAVALLESGFAEGLDFQFYDQALAWLIQNDEWDYAAKLLTSGQGVREDLTDTERSRLLTREARLNLHDGDSDAARSLLQEALTLDAGNDEALMSLAGIYKDSRNYTQAELYYQRASAYDRYRENALISMAQMAIDQDDFDKALTLLREVVSRNPGRVDVRRNIEILEDMALVSDND